MKVGFTGSRNGMSTDQQNAVAKLIDALDAIEGHHGDCVGADAKFHAICLAAGVPVVLHPPSDSRKRAFCEGAIASREPLAFLDRNRQIVLGTAALIASVSGTERTRSGTWATVRFARSKKRPIAIVSKDGNVAFENWTVTPTTVS